MPLTAFAARFASSNRRAELGAQWRIKFAARCLDVPFLVAGGHRLRRARLRFLLAR
jgi:hypothetical protein